MRLTLDFEWGPRAFFAPGSTDRDDEGLVCGGVEIASYCRKKPEARNERCPHCGAFHCNMEGPPTYSVFVNGYHGEELTASSPEEAKKLAEKTLEALHDH